MYFYFSLFLTIYIRKIKMISSCRILFSDAIFPTPSRSAAFIIFMYTSYKIMNKTGNIKCTQAFGVNMHSRFMQITGF